MSDSGLIRIANKIKQLEEENKKLNSAIFRVRQIKPLGHLGDDDYNVAARRYYNWAIQDVANALDAK